jgi:hypothetical protein
MSRLRRIADGVLPWSLVIAAAWACYDVVARWPNARPRPDAAMPIPRLSEELRGPSVDEAMDRFNRGGAEWASPPDAVE